MNLSVPEVSPKHDSGANETNRLVRSHPKFNSTCVPWRDFVNVLLDDGEGDEYAYAECHGFFEDDRKDAFAIIQYLEPKDAPKGGFPFHSWSRCRHPVKRARFGMKYAAVLKFDIISAESIHDVAYLAPNSRDPDVFWHVPSAKDMLAL
jgi:hypothetical protein